MINRIDFYKELYYKELERKSYLTNEVTLISTTLVGLLSGTFYLITSFKNDNSKYLIYFQIAGILCIIITIVAAFFAFKSYYNFSGGGRLYKYLPTITDIEKYYKDCLVQGQNAEFENFVSDILVSVADHHIENNDKKTTLLTKAAFWLSISFMSCSLLAVAFLINFVFILPSQLSVKPKKPKIIINHEPKQRSTQETTASTSSATTTYPTSKTTAKGDNRKRQRQ